VKCSSSISDETSGGKSYFFLAQEKLSEKKKICSGMSFEQIQGTQFGEHLHLVVSKMGDGSMMIYQHLGKAISLHLSTSKHVSVFSERCNPSTCKSSLSVCEGCASMEKILRESPANLSHVTAKDKSPAKFANVGPCCMGMNPRTVFWTVHGSNLRTILKFLHLGSTFQYSSLGDSIVVNKSLSGEISLHSDKCNSTPAISGTVCQECHDFEHNLCMRSFSQPNISMESMIEDAKIKRRIQHILNYWEDESSRLCFMATCFPHIVGESVDLTSTLIPFRVNSKLGHFFLTVSDYMHRLCSGVVGPPSPIKDIENRRWLNNDLVNVIPWVAQTIAAPKLFVLDSMTFYNKLFGSQSQITCMEQVSDSNLEQLFALNFPLDLMSSWKFLFDKNVTVVFIVHDKGHFSNVVFGNLANGSEDTHIPFFAAIDCLISHNRENILHNTKRYYMLFH